MKLSLKQKAFIQALGTLIFAGACGALASLAIMYVPIEAVPYIACAGLLGLALNVLYTVSLSRLEYQEKLKEIAKKD